MCVVGKMSKVIGMGLRKGIVVLFVPTLFGCFLGIPSLYYVISFYFWDLFQLFFEGQWRGYRAIVTPDMHVCIYIVVTQVIGSDDS